MKEEINNALASLKSGGLILYPTDTIWGIGCDAGNTEAVKKIFSLKKRDPSKSLLVLLSSENQLERYVKNVPDICWELIEQSDRPITLVYPEGINLAEGVCADDGSIAVRITDDPFCKTLIDRYNKAVISTSANISNEAFPENFHTISEEIKQGVDYIVNLRQNELMNKPSSILKVGLNGEIKIIRK